MSNPELDRIRQDLARARERVGEIERGERGTRSGPWLETDGGNPGAGIAYERQLLAQRQAVERLEGELVQALIPSWTPARVLAAMSHVCPDSPTALQVVNVDKTRDALQALLSADPGKFINRQKLLEVLK